MFHESNIFKEHFFVCFLKVLRFLLFYVFVMCQGGLSTYDREKVPNNEVKKRGLGWVVILVREERIVQESEMSLTRVMIITVMDYEVDNFRMGRKFRGKFKTKDPEGYTRG